MTVQTTVDRIEFVGNGSNVTFPFNFRVDDVGDLQVFLDDIGTTDFTVSEISNTGGVIIFNTAPDSGAIVLIKRVLPLTQLVEYQDYDAFPAKTHELALDRAVMLIQQFQKEIGPVGPVGLTGPIGPQGLTGETGASVHVEGAATVVEILAKDSTTVGHLWIAEDSGIDSEGNAVVEGDGLISTGTGWLNVGPMRGPIGPIGPQGVPGTPCDTTVLDANSAAIGVNAAGITANTTALGGFKFLSMTQAAYDAIGTPNASTVYLIVG